MICDLYGLGSATRERAAEGFGSSYLSEAITQDAWSFDVLNGDSSEGHGVEEGM
jgi:hypothetical protein